MQLRHIEQVVAVWRAGSISSAARNLRISQPTLSKSLAQLEAELGVKLFDRGEGGATPTTFGALVATRGEEVLRQMNALTDDLRGLAQGKHRRLRIGVGPASRIKPLPHLVKALAQLEPGLQLETRQESGLAIARGLDEGGYDIVLTFAENAANYGHLIRHKLFEDRIAAVVRPGHPLRRGATLDMVELSNFPVASFRVSEGLISSIATMSEAQAANLRALQTDEASLIEELAINTDYVGYAPRFIFEPALALGSLVELDLCKNRLYDCWMLVSAKSWVQPLAKQLATLMRRELANRALQ